MSPTGGSSNYLGALLAPKRESGSSSTAEGGTAPPSVVEAPPIAFGTLTVAEIRAIVRGKATQLVRFAPTCRRVSVHRNDAQQDTAETAVVPAAVTCAPTSRVHPEIVVDLSRKWHVQVRGFTNTGIVCYMNAVLQSLLACHAFVNLIENISWHEPSLVNGDTPVLNSICMLLGEFNLTPVGQRSDSRSTSGGAGGSLCPSYVHDQWYVSERHDVERARQQDAEEFLTFLLESMNRELSQVVKERSLRVRVAGDVNEFLACDKGGRGTSGEADADVDGQHSSGDGAAQDNVLNACSNNNANDDDDNDSGGEWAEVGKGNVRSVKRSLKSDTSPISTLFGGLLRSEIRAARTSSVMVEPFVTVPLDIVAEQVLSVEDALARLVESESIDGFACERSHMPVRATKTLSFERLPPVLVLHLKRFVYTDAYGSQKVTKRIRYAHRLETPLEWLSMPLRLLTVSTSNAHAASVSVDTKKKKTKKAETSRSGGACSTSTSSSGAGVGARTAPPLALQLPVPAAPSPVRSPRALNQYHLSSVVYHHGTRLAGGHYTCDVRRSDGCWLCIDDEHISHISADDVLTHVPGRDAYLLFYTR